MTSQPQKTSVGRLGRLNVFMSFELGNAARGGGGGGGRGSLPLMIRGGSV